MTKSTSTLVYLGMLLHLGLDTSDVSVSLSLIRMSSILVQTEGVEGVR